MQKLTLLEDVFDALATGKATTIRKGRLSIELGDLLFQSAEMNREQVVNVDEVYYSLLKDVKLEDVINDSFKDHDDMVEQMKRFYPDITLDTEVTVIKFERL